MKSLFYAIAFSLMLIAACKKDNIPNRDSLEYFKANLHEDMAYSALTNTFGEPSADKGSGIHIYVYKLNDGSEIWIGFADKIIYARHMSENGVLLSTLIE